MIPGLLGFGELESLEVVERGSGSAGDDALVKRRLFPLLVDLAGGPSLLNGARACTMRDGHLVFEETHVLERHGLSWDALNESLRILSLAF